MQNVALKWDAHTQDAYRFGREILVLDHYLLRLQRQADDLHEIRAHSELIRALKRSDESAISHFTNRLASLIPTECAIACVPSHREGNIQTGIHQVSRRLCASQSRTDATTCLRRFITIPKLAYGGLRNEGLHFESIRVEFAHLIQDRNVVLLDDVMTTGCSLRACKTLLLAAVAKSVQPIALGRTVRGEI